MVVVGLCGAATDPSVIVQRLVPPGTAPIVHGPYVTVLPPGQKRPLTLCAASAVNVISVAHLASVADTVLFVTSATAPIDAFGELAMTCIRSQGTSAVAHLLIDLQAVPQKRRGQCKKELTKDAIDDFPETKVLEAGGGKDAAQILWALVNQKRKTLSWRDKHPYMLAHSVAWQPDAAATAAAAKAAADEGEAAPTSPLGVMTVQAYVRGKALDPNRLVYLPGSGAYQLGRVDIATAAAGLEETRSAAAAFGKGKAAAAGVAAGGGGGGGMEVSLGGAPTATGQSLLPTMEGQESLQTEVPLDPLAGEQTWPTDAEIAAAQAEGGGGGAAAGAGGGMATIPEPAEQLVRVAKGTSSYQANWIVEAFGEDGEDGEDGNDAGVVGIDEVDMDAVEDALAAVPRAAGGGSGSVAGGAASSAGGSAFDMVKLDGREAAAKEYDANMDGTEEDAARKFYEASREDAQFPDEMDTPTNMDAKVRFQKYRGLQSFRHSPWNPREELPEEYARIFQFQNFNATQRRVLKSDPDLDGLPCATVGSYVTLHIANVPQTVAEAWKVLNRDTPLVVYSLLQHENKMCVLNFKIKMRPEYTEPIKSKERLIFYTGLRQFSACPIFSQHSYGDKHKFERYFQPGSMAIATCMGPIHYPPSPTLIFKKNAAGKLDLVATGDITSCNPDRIVLKRIRLAGHPFKINKRSATVRYMFWNEPDIRWFKPVELVTAYGRRGHIIESLGTHGHMKCRFDGQVTAQDCVFMNLYKRVYPKWTYSELALGGVV